MLLADMHTQFKIEVDKIDSFNSQLFEPEEIDVLFNTYQYKLIKDVNREGLERTQTQIEMLGNLILTQPLNNFLANNPLVNKPNGYFIGLPNDYLKTINEECLCNVTDCNGNVVQERRWVIPTTHDKVNNALQNPFTKPNNDYALRLAYSNINSNSPAMHEIITHDGQPAWYLLTYMKEPVQMHLYSQYPAPFTGADVECELNSEAQQWIIEESVKQALLNIESQRYPGKRQEQYKSNY